MLRNYRSNSTDWPFNNFKSLLGIYIDRKGMMRDDGSFHVFVIKHKMNNIKKKKIEEYKIAV